VDELLDALNDIKELLVDTNANINAFRDDIKDIRGHGLYDTISDLADKLELINDGINAISSSGVYTLQDIYFKD